MGSFHKRSKRKRGVILSSFGWQRLQNAHQNSEIEVNSEQPLTLEYLKRNDRRDSYSRKMDSD